MHIVQKSEAHSFLRNRSHEGPSLAFRLACPKLPPAAAQLGEAGHMQPREPPNLAGNDPAAPKQPPLGACPTCPWLLLCTLCMEQGPYSKRGTQALPVSEEVPFPGKAAPRTEEAPVPTAIQGFSVP